MIEMGEFEIVKEKNGKLTWRFIQGGNNKTIARSFDEYDNVEDLEYDILVLKDQASSSGVNEQVKKYFQASGGNKKSKRFGLF